MDTKGLTSTAECTKDLSNMQWWDAAMEIPHEGLRRMFLGLHQAKIDSLEKAAAFQEAYELFRYILTHHHDMEEAVVFPALVAKGATLPQNFYDDHEELHHLLDKVKGLSVACVSDLSVAGELKSAVDELVDLLSNHFREEEDEMSNLLKTYMTFEEHEALTQKIAMSLGIVGSKRFLPLIVYAMRMAGGSYGRLTVEAFLGNLPPPLQEAFPEWYAEFERENLNVILSLAA